MRTHQSISMAAVRRQEIEIGVKYKKSCIFYLCSCRNHAFPFKFVCVHHDPFLFQLSLTCFDLFCSC